MNMDEAQEYIEKSKEDIEKEVDNLEQNISKHMKELKDLKVALYAKFGNNINLEEEDEN